MRIYLGLRRGYGHMSSIISKMIWRVGSVHSQLECLTLWASSGGPSVNNCVVERRGALPCWVLSRYQSFILLLLQYYYRLEIYTSMHTGVFQPFRFDYAMSIATTRWSWILPNWKAVRLRSMIKCPPNWTSSNSYTSKSTYALEWTRSRMHFKNLRPHFNSINRLCNLPSPTKAVFRVYHRIIPWWVKGPRVTFSFLRPVPPLRSNCKASMIRPPPLQLKRTHKPSYFIIQQTPEPDWNDNAQLTTGSHVSTPSTPVLLDGFLT